MELRHLRYFVALADDLNFTRAAARCWVSQQAFSRAIAALEHNLGTALVVRRPRGCSLTPAGARLATASRNLLAQADELRLTLADTPSAVGQGLRIGLLLDGLGPVTSGVLSGFRAAMPDVALSVCRLQPHELPAAIVDGFVDVALLHGPVDDERVVTVPLFSEPRSVVLSAADERAAAASLTAADLLDLPARSRRAGIDPIWEGFFTLRSERNGEDPQRLGEPTGSLEELLWAISVDRLFLTVPAHLSATYPGAAYGVTYVAVDDLAPVDFAACYRRGDDRSSVAQLVALARAMSPTNPAYT